MSDKPTKPEAEADDFIEAVNQAAEQVKAVQGSPIHLLTGKPSERKGHRCAVVAGALGFAIIHEGRSPEESDPKNPVEISGSMVVDASKTEGDGDEAFISDKDGNIVDAYDISVTFFSARMIPKLQQALQAASSMFFQTGVNLYARKVIADAEAEANTPKDPNAEVKEPDNITGFPEPGKN